MSRSQVQVRDAPTEAKGETDVEAQDDKDVEEKDETEGERRKKTKTCPVPFHPIQTQVKFLQKLVTIGRGLKQSREVMDVKSQTDFDKLTIDATQTISSNVMDSQPDVGERTQRTKKRIQDFQTKMGPICLTLGIVSAFLAIAVGLAFLYFFLRKLSEKSQKKSPELGEEADRLVNKLLDIVNEKADELLKVVNNGERLEEAKDQVAEILSKVVDITKDVSEKVVGNTKHDADLQHKAESFKYFSEEILYQQPDIKKYLAFIERSAPDSYVCLCPKM